MINCSWLQQAKGTKHPFLPISNALYHNLFTNCFSAGVEFTCAMLHPHRQSDLSFQRRTFWFQVPGPGWQGQLCSHSPPRLPALPPAALLTSPEHAQQAGTNRPKLPVVR